MKKTFDGENKCACVLETIEYDHISSQKISGTVELRSHDYTQMFPKKLRIPFFTSQLLRNEILWDEFL